MCNINLKHVCATREVEKTEYRSVGPPTKKKIDFGSRFSILKSQISICLQIFRLVFNFSIRVFNIFLRGLVQWFF